MAQQQTTPLLRQRLKRPNILITGTPGTGKTITAQHIAVSEWVGEWIDERLID